MRRLALFGGIALAAAAPLAGAAAEGGFAPAYWELYGQAEGETTLFAQAPAHAGQARHDVSFAVRPTLLAEWLEGDLAFTLTPFLRLDGADDRRTHADLREAKLDWRAGNWSVTAGADFVFWGKTEAVHLVDIVNSADGVESPDLEDKLGQPMLRVAYWSEWGRISAFYLPYFREPSFAGTDGRLRGALPVDTGATLHGRGGGEWAPSFALRWAHAVGDVDFGLSGFYGTSRDAGFQPIGPAPQTPTALAPVYDAIAQVGFDGQYTSGAALWKLEAIARFDQVDRTGRKQDYAALTGGVEYTLFGVAETNADLGLILEGAWDSRGADALSAFEEDAIYGIRLTLNDPQDSSLLLLGVSDVVSGSASLRLEAERRIASHWKLGVEGQAFLNPQPEELEYGLRRDSFLRLTLSYYW